VNPVDNEGGTPLHNATYNGHVECAQILLKNKVAVLFFCILFTLTSALQFRPRWIPKMKTEERRFMEQRVLAYGSVPSSSSSTQPNPISWTRTNSRRYILRHSMAAHSHLPSFSTEEQIVVPEITMYASVRLRKVETLTLRCHQIEYRV